MNGCFWHAHDCPRGGAPSSNVEFWQRKIGKNRERDQVVWGELHQEGWRVPHGVGVRDEGPGRDFSAATVALSRRVIYAQATAKSIPDNNLRVRHYGVKWRMSSSKQLRSHREFSRPAGCPNGSRPYHVADW